VNRIKKLPAGSYLQGDSRLKLKQKPAQIFCYSKQKPSWKSGSFLDAAGAAIIPDF